MSELLKFLPEGMGSVIVGAVIAFVGVLFLTPELTQRAIDLQIAQRCPAALKRDAVELGFDLRIDPAVPCACAIEHEQANYIDHAVYVYTLGYIKGSPFSGSVRPAALSLGAVGPRLPLPDFSYVDYLYDRTWSVLQSGACGDVAGFFADPVEEARKQAELEAAREAARLAAEAERVRLELQREAMRMTKPMMDAFEQMFRGFGR